MALSIIKFGSGKARFIPVVMAVVCLVTAWFFIKWNFANAVTAKLDPMRPDARILTEWTAEMAPSDPQTRRAAGVVLEKTFDADDLARSMNEFEAAASLSPNNYFAWLDLGKARSSAGDTAGANAAFEKALSLAPNYASLHWAYGNALVRQGRGDEGFAMIAKAATADPEYSKAAVITALQLFENDADLVRTALGDSETTNVALAGSLADFGKFTDALAAWSRLSDTSAAKHSQLGVAIAAKAAAAGYHKVGAGFLAKLAESDEMKPQADQITNGGFEGGVKLSGAGVFEWQISEGPSPQIGLSESQKRSGKYGLIALFNSLDTAAFRNISQVVAVTPGSDYELAIFYRTDINSNAQLKWEVINASDQIRIAVSQPLSPVEEWTAVQMRFKAPAASDGVIVRLIREGCVGPTCPMNGKLVLDDLSLRKL